MTEERSKEKEEYSKKKKKKGKVRRGLKTQFHICSSLTSKTGDALHSICSFWRRMIDAILRVPQISKLCVFFTTTVVVTMLSCSSFNKICS